MNRIVTRIQKVIDIQVKDVKINNKPLRIDGLLLKENQNIIIVEKEEVKEIYIPGRDMPYHQKIRNLPIEFSIEFYTDENSDCLCKELDKWVDLFKNSILSFNGLNDYHFKVFSASYNYKCKKNNCYSIKFNFLAYSKIN